MKYSWGHRSSHPSEFPIVCPECQPDERRFKLPKDFQLHNSMTTKHGVSNAKKRERWRRGKRGKSQTIESIISERVLPDENYRRICNGTVKSLGNVLKHNLPERYRPAEVIKAGSTGKGTSIKGISDVDLVFFLPDSISTIQQYQANREQILRDVETTLRQAQYKVISRSTKAVQVRVRCNEHGCGTGHDIDIDILPAVNLHAEDRTRDHIYNLMKNSQSVQSQFFTPSLTKWQRDFVKRDRPEKLKKLIRFVKHWKNNMINVKTKPSSYFFELVIIDRWKKAGYPRDFGFNSALGDVMNTLADPQNIGVEFVGEFYDSSMKQNRSLPYVIDPVNPYSDVMADYSRWNAVGNFAEQFMRRGEMKEVVPGFR